MISQSAFVLIGLMIQVSSLAFLIYVPEFAPQATVAPIWRQNG